MVPRGDAGLADSPAGLGFDLRFFDLRFPIAFGDLGI